MTRVYQAQVCRRDWRHELGKEEHWVALSTQSGGTICSTAGGAKSKLKNIKTQKCRVVEFTLSDPVVIEERNFE